MVELVAAKEGYAKHAIHRSEKDHSDPAEAHLWGPAVLKAEHCPAVQWTRCAEGEEAPQWDARASSVSHVRSGQRVRSKLVRFRHLVAITTPVWSPTCLQPERRSDVSDVFAAHTCSCVIGH